MTFGKNLLTWLSGWIPIDMGSISLWNLLCVSLFWPQYCLWCFADAVLPGSKPVVHGAPGYARYFRLTAFLAGVFYRLCLLRGKYGPIFGSIRLYRRGDRFIALALFQRDYADYGR